MICRDIVTYHQIHQNSTCIFWSRLATFDNFNLTKKLNDELELVSNWLVHMFLSLIEPLGWINFEDTVYVCLKLKIFKFGRIWTCQDFITLPWERLGFSDYYFRLKLLRYADLIEWIVAIGSCIVYIIRQTNNLKDSHARIFYILQ